MNIYSINRHLKKSWVGKNLIWVWQIIILIKKKKFLRTAWSYTYVKRNVADPKVDLKSYKTFASKGNVSKNF